MGYEQFANPKGGYGSADTGKAGYNTIKQLDNSKTPRIIVQPGAKDIDGFKPSQNGLKYSNSWTDDPYAILPTPFGPIPISKASKGMCGGMAYAVRDLFEANKLPPKDTVQPKPYSKAFNYLYARLLQSFALPYGPVIYYTLMDPDRHIAADGPASLSWITLMRTMPILRSTIDSGHLCPLGLICTQSKNIFDLGLNHQVLAWGYHINEDVTTIRLYDPNHPNNDNVELTFKHTKPQGLTKFYYSPAKRTVHGFFVTNYSPEDPSDLFYPE